MSYQRILMPAALILVTVVAALPQQAGAQTVAAVSATEGPFTRDAFYVGGTMGTAFNAGATDWQGYGFDAQNVNTLANKAASSVFQAGLLVGYQHYLESAPVMIGVEADINYLGDMYGDSSGSYVQQPGAGIAPAGTYDLRSGRNTNYYGTLRGHLGYVVDNMQFFVSGGFAYAGNSSAGESTVTYTDPLGNTRSLTGSGSSQSHTGSVFGGGFEYGFDAHLAARLEYEYVSLKNSNITLNDPMGGQHYIVNEVKEHFSVARVGVIYSF